MKSLLERQKKEKERVALIGVYGQDVYKEQAEEYLEELALLADTADGITIEKFLQNKEHPDPQTYIGRGKLEELRDFSSDNEIDALIFDDDLSATQARNIEEVTKVKVLDRSNLILDIFASRAKTSAAKTQVELAQLQYLLPRLTRYWTHLSRQKGGIGTKGPGETQIETDRRLVGQRIAVLKEKLQKLDKQRQTQRKRRSEQLRFSLVGYTNAGKSSLMNAMTDTGVFAEDRLFATLDSTVRKLELSTESVLLSDTVGFIRKLPHNLIESFKTTLDEIRESDVLIHVVDASSNLFREYIETVEETLKEIDADIRDVIYVFNKVDKVQDAERIATIKGEYPDAVFTSAIRGIGMKQLREKMEEEVAKDYFSDTLMLPIENSKAVSFLHDNADVEEIKYEEDSVFVRFRMNRKYLGGLKKLIPRTDFEEKFVYSVEQSH